MKVIFLLNDMCTKSVSRSDEKTIYFRYVKNFKKELKILQRLLCSIEHREKSRLIKKNPQFQQNVQLRDLPYFGNVSFVVREFLRSFSVIAHSSEE
jgi:hypothetical protein